jgi:DeoR family fructose operon transcriptional repressor
MSEPRYFGPERHAQIVDRLRSAGRVEIGALAAELQVSGETIRKDLIQLERRGLVRRVHGGAVPPEPLDHEPAVSRRSELVAEKTRIARAALAYLPGAGAIVIDAGSTTALLADQMPAVTLTVYTNTLPIALALALVQRPQLTVCTLGGRVRPVTLAEVDEIAARTLADINVDVAFLGTNGLSLERGLTTPDAAEAATKRLMLRTARRRVLLIDHSKIGLVRGHRHADLADIDVLVTDRELPVLVREAAEAAGVSVTYAD